VKAFESIPDGAVTEITMPKRWAPRTALRNRSELVGYVAGTDLSPDSLLQKDMLITPPDLKPGEREVAILVDAETGVAGKIHPNSVVDIIATYAGGNDKPDQAEVVVPGARVIDVGVTVRKNDGKVQQQDTEPQSVVPVTFALTPEQDLAVTHAETFASEVRLALLRPGDLSELTEKQRKFTRKP
jgi:pilus assembly protein CpaB